MDVSNLRKRAVPTAFLAAAIMLALFGFMRNNASRIARQNAEYLEQLTIQRAESINSLISENEAFISSIAYLYGKSLSSPWADVAVIREYEAATAFDYLRFIDASGDDYTSKGVMANLADRDYFQAGMRGEEGITFVAGGRVTGERQVGFYAPVTFDGDVIGVMVGFYGEGFVQRLLTFELFGHEGRCWLCAADGTVIGTTNHSNPENLFAYLGEEGRCDQAELGRLEEAFAEGHDLSFTYHEDGSTTNGYAVALDHDGWMLVRGFPATASEQIVHNANRAGELLIVELLVLFLAYVAYLVASFLRERRRMREESRDASDVSAGVERLFEAFFAVDLAGQRYRLVGGQPQGEAIPAEGDYASLRDLMLSHVPEGERAGAAGFLSADDLAERLATRDTVSYRMHAPLGDVEWFTFVFIVLSRDEAGVVERVLLACQDFTELHDREEAEQRQLQDALDVAERASRAKTEFLFNMSHDIRTPMNAIIGYTELAQREGATAEELSGYVRKIDASSKHLLALINDILEMSRIESGKMVLEPATCDLVRVMDDLRGLFATQMAGKGIDFSVSCEHVDDRWVLCDRNRLDRILLNLVSNAYKFTAEGGHVRVTLTQTGAEGGEGRYELSVADDGIGMGEEFAKRVFNPFERERTSTVSGVQGTGLGLSITKSIVDLMMGEISLATRQGEGTTFTVRLAFPLAKPPAEAPKTDDGPALERLAGRRLLLVEDNPVNREIATIILEGHGFAIEVACDGSEAVAAMEAAPAGHFACVLMDVQMPVMDGYEATRRIRALADPARAAVPIVAMTANAFAEDVAAARAAGMDGHIAKPIEVDKMLETLAQVIGD